MVNCTDIISCYNYNLSLVVSDDAINHGSHWLAAFNSLTGGLFITGSLVVLGLVLYFLMKNNLGLDDVDSVSYAGIIVSLLSALLFFVNTGDQPKLIAWIPFSVFIIITAISMGVGKFSKSY